MRLRRIIEVMEAAAPSYTAMKWDNVGLQTGDVDQEVGTLLLALDVTDEVVTEAIELGAEAIISHHPMMFKPVYSITTATGLGARLIRLIKNDIAVYSSHTNLDASERGTNAALFDRLGLINRELLLRESEKYGTLGYAGMLPETERLDEFAKRVKALLGLDSIRYVGDGGMEVSKVGLCTGDASDLEFIIAAVKLGCDCYITGDLKYHNSQYALEAGLGLIDATHYSTEALITDYLKSYLTEELDDLNIVVSKVDGQVFKTV